MNKKLGLRIFSQIMDWDDESAKSATEYDWLLFMAAYKYDGYRDYLAGARFMEHLCTWLQQFKPEDRNIAYDFLKEKLIYFSPEEIQRLVEKFFPEFVQPNLIKSASRKLGIKPYMIWSTEEGITQYMYEKRKTLFMGLSDGARLDSLRRGNSNIISNEQIVITVQTDSIKWESLINDLRDELSKIIPGADVSKEKFSRVYLVDDFTASGTSLIPDPDNNKKKELKGKLVKFGKSISENGIKDRVFEDDFDVYVHHYIGTVNAKNSIEKVYNKVSEDLKKLGLPDIGFTFGMMLSKEIAYDENTNDPFVRLCKEYYNDIIEGEKGKKEDGHGAQSGTTDKMFGYAQCGLPIVLEHNTPNNSLPLIWADTTQDTQENRHKMRPLFYRRERHSDLKVSKDENSG